MENKSKVLVIEHVTKEKLDEHVTKLEKVVKKVNRLHFIQLLYEGFSVRKASSILGIPVKTGYNWLKKWNEEGIDGLSHKQGAGRPSFLSEDQLKEVDEYISSHDNLGTSDVHY
ncbi:MAG: helix-turn-helix domain-containing protein, partial [Methanobrevibacter sp.]|nr:helix-turn-helix domain-containing protein [Candidatus Methanoflexus mossambicus]